MIAVSIFVFWPILLITPGVAAYVNSIILTKFVFPKYGWNLKDEEDDIEAEVTSED